MKTIRVFRVHHQSGKEIGPWRSDGAYRPYNLREALEKSVMGRDGTCKPTHPLPNMDGIKYVTCDHFFGVKDLNSLVHWFEEAEVELFLAGFVVSEFEIEANNENVLIGKTQVAFILAEAKHIRTFVLDSKKDLKP